MPDPFGLAAAGGSADPATLALLAVAALLAGWVDAVVGGGGLIQLPALVIGLPGAAPAQLLATNKLGSICGTSVSALTYYRRIGPDLRTAVPMAVAAYLGSVGGAFVGLHIPKAAFNPIILVMLLDCLALGLRLAAVRDAVLVLVVLAGLVRVAHGALLWWCGWAVACTEVQRLMMTGFLTVVPGSVVAVVE
jgi:hypothetical protein